MWLFVAVALFVTLVSVVAVKIDRVMIENWLGGKGSDFGPRLPRNGAETTWHATATDLGNSGFKACAGPLLYNDDKTREPEIYIISVEKVLPDSSVEKFRRELRVSELPGGFVKIHVKEFARYDEAQRSVTFTLGDKVFHYPLPKP